MKRRKTTISKAEIGDRLWLYRRHGTSFLGEYLPKGWEPYGTLVEKEWNPATKTYRVAFRDDEGQIYRSSAGGATVVYREEESVR